MIRHALATLLLGASLLLAGPTGLGLSAAYAQDGCLSSREARAAVSGGEAKPFSAFFNRAQRQGQVVSSCLARRGGGYVYIYQVMGANGQISSHTISAK